MILDTANQKECITSKTEFDVGVAYNAPIIRALEYQCLARKLLLVDDMAFDKETDNIETYPDLRRPYYSVVSQEGSNGEHSMPSHLNVPGPITFLGQKTEIPKIEVKDQLDFNKELYNTRRFYYADQAQMEAKDFFQKKETNLVVKNLVKIAESQKMLIEEKEFSPIALNNGFRILENKETAVIRVVMHPNMFANLRVFGRRDFFAECSSREILTYNIYGRIWTAEVHVTCSIDKNDILLTGSPDKVGEFCPVQEPHFSIDFEESKVKFNESFGIGLYGDNSAVLRIFKSTAI